jgi:ATP synthase protein I
VTDPAEGRSSDDLDARIRAAKARHAPEPRQVAASALARGTRYAAEIAVATVVGFGLGWFLDRQFGTGPWLAILFLMLGVAAGFRNLLRAVEQETRAVEAEAAEAAEREDNGPGGPHGSG